MTSQASGTAPYSLSNRPSNSSGALGDGSPSKSSPTAAGGGGGGAGVEGMRREWNFTITLAHQTAKATLHLLPQWESVFAPPELIEKVLDEGFGGGGVGSNTKSSMQRGGGNNANKGSSTANYQQHPQAGRKGAVPTPMVHWYGYTDVTSAQQAGGAAGAAAPSLSLPSPFMPAPSSISSPAETWGGTDGIRKEVALYYALLPAPMPLSDFCQDAVRQVLNCYPNIITVDGDANLTQLRMGRKVSGCADLLGGQPSFSFRFTTHGTSTRKAEHGIAIGTSVGLRGYIAILRCEREGELEGYYKGLFLRHFKDGAKLGLGKEVAYVSECSNTTLSNAQSLYGELQYFDRDALVAFALPMHPMRVRPDFSPTQTVGVGSITCMTFELAVYQRVEVDLLEEGEGGGGGELLGEGGGRRDGGARRGGGGIGGTSDVPMTAGAELAAADLTKYRPANAVLFLDVEVVAKQGYPASMSINNYLQLKIKRLFDTFKDAKLVGETQMGHIGPRVARSQHVTFTYEGNPSDVGVVKALVTATLVGNNGITAIYFTRLAQGLFDHHLYLYQHFVRSFRLFSEGDLRSHFTRFETRHKARLTDVELAKVYPPSVAANPAKEAHFRALAASTEGRCEGAVVYVVDPQTLVCVRKEEGAEGPVASAASPNSTTTTTDAADGSAVVAAGAKASASSPLASASAPPSSTSARGRAFSGGDETTAPPSSLSGLGGAASAAAAVIDDPTVISVVGVVHLAARALASALLEEDGDGDGEDASGDDSYGPEGTSEAAGPQAKGRSSAAAAAAVSVGAASEEEGSPPRRSTLTASAEGGGDAAGSAEAARSGGGVAAVVGVGMGGEEGGPRASASDEGGAFSPHTATDEASSHTSPNTRGSGSGSGGAGSSSFPPTADGSSEPATAAGAASSGVDKGCAEGGEGTQSTPPPPKSSALVEAVLAAEDGPYFGPSLRDVYCRCCEAMSCRPNSYLFNKLPRSARFTESIEELDLSSNYLGHQGFQAILNFLEYLPKIQTLVFNDMSLDNEDIRHLCECLEKNTTVRAVHLRSNPKVTLPATRYLTRLVKVNTRIHTLTLKGTGLGEGLAGRIEADASTNKR